jgi:hypothetical protein
VLGGHNLCKEISTEEISISIPISYVPLLRDACTQIHVTILQWYANQASPVRRMESEWILREIGWGCD